MRQEAKKMKRHASDPITVYVGHHPFRTGARGPVWIFWCPEFPSTTSKSVPAVYGASTEPLLDACRMLCDLLRGPDRKRRVNLVDHETGMLRLTSIASIAARLTVFEPNAGKISFQKWFPHYRSPT
jgi:hypothetical protein